jgi:peptidoglycan/LPS O-acetylase OafA/YrhL
MTLHSTERPVAELSRERLAAADAHAAFRKRRHFGSLDGLRAISVVGVIWHHTAPPYEAGQPYLIANGHHGVTLFFAISGFLIVSLLLREQDRTGAIDLRAFYLRRSLRIFPLYYTVLALYTLLVFALERDHPVGREFFANLPFFITYTSNWFVLLEGRVIFYFAWSLAAEEQFYLVWPTIQKFLSLRAALSVLGAIIVCVIAAQLLLPAARPARTALADRMLAGIPLAICFGVLLAHAMHHPHSFRALRRIYPGRGSSLLWLAVLVACLSWPRAPEFLVHACAALFVGACVYREDHWLAALLRWRPLVHVGAVSYGIYLLHMLVKNAVLQSAHAARLELWPLAPFLLTVLGSVAVATLSFRHFESIFLRMKPRTAAA